MKKRGRPKAAPFFFLTCVIRWAEDCYGDRGVPGSETPRELDIDTVTEKLAGHPIVCGIISHVGVRTNGSAPSYQRLVSAGGSARRSSSSQRADPRAAAGLSSSHRDRDVDRGAGLRRTRTDGATGANRQRRQVASS